MPIGCMLNLTGNAIANPHIARLSLNGRARNASLVDFVNLTLTATHDLADAVASPYRVFGVQVEMDDGAGLHVLSQSELGPIINIRDGLDQIGRQLAFSRLLPKGSPLISDLLRGMRQIRVTGLMGITPAKMQSRVLFDGNLLSASFSGIPPVAQITAQDASVLYAEKKLILSIPEGSGRTRLDIVTQVLTSHGIPYGTLDLGPNSGGTVKKAIDVGGDTNLFDWLKSFVSPCGRRIRFNSLRQLEIGRFDETGSVTRVLLASNINNLTVTPSATNTENQISMAGATVQLKSTAQTASRSGSGGLSSGMIVTATLNMTEYAPQTATKVQDHVTGNISDAVIPPVARSPFTSGLTTATQITISADGATVDVTEIVDQYGFYAQGAAQYHISNSAGALSWNSVFDVFLFSDGSAHAVNEETYRHLSRTTTNKIYIGGKLTQSLVTVGKIDPDASNPFNGSSWNSGTNVLVTASREQWNAGGGGKDDYFDVVSQTLTTYALAPDGQHLLSIFEIVTQFVGATGIVFSGYTYQNTGDPSSGQLAETLSSSKYASQIASLTATVGNPQTLTAVSTDAVRAGLTTLITAYQQNDYCENTSELMTAAFFALRDTAKMLAEFDMPVDMMLDDGGAFTMPIPVIGSSDPIVVGALEIQIDGRMATNSQKITGWKYPQNLAAAS